MYTHRKEKRGYHVRKRSIRFHHWFTVIFFSTLAIVAQAQSQALVLADLPTSLSKMLENHYLPSVVVGMGSFTYSDTNLPSSFARWFEDQLRAAFTKTPSMKLLDGHLAAAMDPELRKLYTNLSNSTLPDSLIYGTYQWQPNTVSVQLDLTDLATGSLISCLRYDVPASVIPRNETILPSNDVVKQVTELISIPDTEVRSSESFTLSMSADRGKGASYRDGEYLTLFLTSNADAYLKIYHVDVDGKAQLIWPNKFGGSGRIKAGQAMEFPGPTDGFRYLLGKPYGTEYIKAIASLAPFAAMEVDFSDLDGSALEAIDRGKKVTSAGQPGRAEALVVYEIQP
jgi:hypothetical protein